LIRAVIDTNVTVSGLLFGGLPLKSSRHLDRFLEIIEEGHQGPDHPVHPAIPETGYLKAFFARLLPS
jgi:23S rRNA (cytosine1962-C5)-methyltransferase